MKQTNNDENQIKKDAKNDDAKENEFASFKAELHKKIGEKNSKEAKSTTYSHSVTIRIVSELVAGIAVGFLIGFTLDHYLDTKPIFLFIFLLLGISAAFLNIYRSMKKINQDNDQDT